MYYGHPVPSQNPLCFLLKISPLQPCYGYCLPQIPWILLCWQKWPNDEYWLMKHSFLELLESPWKQWTLRFQFRFWMPSSIYTQQASNVRQENLNTDIENDLLTCNRLKCQISPAAYHFLLALGEENMLLGQINVNINLCFWLQSFCFSFVMQRFLAPGKWFMTGHLSG